MSWKNVSAIQTGLGIELPQWFCQFAEKNYDRLQKMLMERFYGDADSLIQNNLEYRTNSTGLPETFPDWWKSYLLLGDNCAGDWTCIRVNGSEDRKLVVITSNGCDESPYDDDTEEYFEEMFEYYRRGYDYGSYMPLPEQLMLQQELAGPLHRHLIGIWTPQEPTGNFHVSMEFRINQLLTTRSLDSQELTRLQEHIQKFPDALHCESYGRWIAENGVPQIRHYQVLSTYPDQSTLVVRCCDSNGYGHDWRMVFCNELQTLGLSSKEYFKKKFGEPALWKRQPAEPTLA